MLNRQNTERREKKYQESRKLIETETVSPDMNL